MDPQPKDDAAKAKSIQIVKQINRVTSRPLAWMLLPWQGLKRLLARRMSPEQLRVADKERQAEVRRQLRGLTPVHDSDKHIS